jgi:hypothetical protein
MRRAIVSFIFPALLLGVICPRADAQLDDSTNNEVLRGLRGIKLTIEKISADAEADGLTQRQIQTDTELRLRQAGIRLLTEQEWNEAEYGGAWLFVYVGVVKEAMTNQVFACSVRLRLQQAVSLIRDPSVKTFATTWSTGSTGIFGIKKLQDVRKELGDKVDEFINSYLAANPP